MTRVHDMGGRFGDGPILRATDEPVFSEEWHGRALGLTIACSYVAWFSIDANRYAREALPPKDYTRFSYYEKWIAGMTNQLVDAGIITLDELTGGAPQPSDLTDRKMSGEEVAAGIARGGPSDRASEIAPIFEVGDTVRTLRPAGNRKVPGGHTRLPGYAAGARGRVVMYHGAHVLPDSNAHGLGEAPEPLYAVAFPAYALWTDPEHPRDEVILDAWQSYLEPA